MNEIGKAIVEKLDTSIEEEAKKYKEQETQKYNRASEAGWIFDCPRRLVLRRLSPELEEMPALKQLRRMNEGKRQEKMIRQELLDRGIEIRPATRMTNDKLQLTGEVDDMVKVNGDFFPIDYKAYSSSMFKQIINKDYQQVLNSPFIWVRHVPTQVALYDFLYNFMLGILLFKDKDANEKWGIDVPLDKKLVLEVVNGLEEVNEAVATKKCPLPEYKDRVCDYCGFQKTCFPESPMAKTQFRIIEDVDWVQKVKDYQAMVDAGIKEKAKAFKNLEDEIKDEFRGDTVIIGSHIVDSKSYFTTVYDIPQEEKAKYAKSKEQFRVSIKLIESL